VHLPSNITGDEAIVKQANASVIQDKYNPNMAMSKNHLMN